MKIGFLSFHSHLFCVPLQIEVECYVHFPFYTGPLLPVCVGLVQAVMLLRTYECKSPVTAKDTISQLSA